MSIPPGGMRGVRREEGGVRREEGGVRREELGVRREELGGRRTGEAGGGRVVWTVRGGGKCRRPLFYLRFAIYDLRFTIALFHCGNSAICANGS